MLRKLLKYDLKAMFKEMLPIYAFSIGSFILYKITWLVSDNSENIIRETFALISGFFLVIFAISIIVSLIASFFVGVKRFYQNVLKGEGYLTNTLPINKSTIYFSKLLSSAIVVIITTLFVFIILLINDPNEFSIYHSELLNEIYPGFNGYQLLFLIILVTIAQLLFSTTLFFNAMSIGFAFNGNKTVKSIIAGVTMYLVFQAISIIAILMFVFYQEASGAIQYTNDSNIDEDKIVVNLLYFSVFLNIIFIAINSIVSITMLNKKINLE